MKELPGEFDVLLLRLGKHQWKSLLAKCGKKPQMSLPGPFFKPKCRSINLPMMDGSTSTHGEINVVTITKSTSMLGGEILPLGLKLICFAKEHVADATKVGCIFITEVQSGGLAARVPLIAKGCRILEINGRSTLSITRESAEHKMKNAKSEIKMVIQRLDDMQFIRLCKRMLVDASNLDDAEVDKDAVSHDIPGMNMVSALRGCLLTTARLPLCQSRTRVRRGRDHRQPCLKALLGTVTPPPRARARPPSDMQPRLCI